MKIETYKSGSIPEHVFESVSELLHDAFEERRQQGLNFQCGLFSPEDVKAYLNERGILLVCYDDYNIPVGTLTLIPRVKGEMSYLSHDNLAISNDCKGQGIATKLFYKMMEIAKDMDVDFISSTTATTARSSVIYHQKRGFKIRQKSFGHSYNAYNFILPIKRFNWLKVEPLRLCIYAIFTLKNMIKKTII